jgi:hypothetical protein
MWTLALLSLKHGPTLLDNNGWTPSFLKLRGSGVFFRALWDPSLAVMEVHFSPEQEAQLSQIAITTELPPNNW